VLSRKIRIFAVSSLVLNLFASQIGEFFLPQPVLGWSLHSEIFLQDVGTYVLEHSVTIFDKFGFICVLKTYVLRLNLILSYQLLFRLLDSLLQ